MEILVVEPPGDFRDAVVERLRAGGAEVRTADDALEALGRVRALVPDVVLVAEAAGDPGAAAVCRIVQRHLPGVETYALADGPLESDRDGAVWLARGEGAEAVARRVGGETS